jgi:hypothetical protein
MVALLCLHRDARGIRDVRARDEEGAAGQHRSTERQTRLCHITLCCGADSWETYFYATFEYTCTARQTSSLYLTRQREWAVHRLFFQKSSVQPSSRLVLH